MHIIVPHMQDNPAQDVRNPLSSYYRKGKKVRARRCVEAHHYELSQGQCNAALPQANAQSLDTNHALSSID